MRPLNKVIIIALLSFSNLCSFGQAQPLVRKLVKLLSKEGTESWHVVESGASREEKLLMKADPETIAQIKKAHPGESLTTIKLTDAEVQKLLQKQFEQDHPYEAAQRRKTNQIYEDIFIRSAIRNRNSSDGASRILDPKAYFEEVETFISIPSSEQEYLNMFKNKDEAPMRNTLNLYNQVKTTGKTNHFFPSSKDILIKSLQKKSDNLVVIIGHNENGNLYFPDGSTLSFKQIDKTAKENSRMVVYLSCNAASYTSNPAVNYFLDYSQALDLNQFLNMEISYFRKDITPEKVTENINALLTNYAAQRALNYKLKVVAYTAAGGGLAYGLYQIKDK
jgi:hypothetical protein